MQKNSNVETLRTSPYAPSQKPKGLTEDEVRKSREQHGENRFSKKKRKGFFKSFLESFGDPMIKVLLIALAVNVIFLFHDANWFESVGIALAILLATLVSTLSEYGSESAFEKLQEEASRIHCRVQRAQGLCQLPIEQIVVDDLVLLQPGDRIPADGLLLEGSLEVDQSSLNGESKEAKKQAGFLGKAATQGKDGFLNPTLLFSGTIVCSGEGLMQVRAVGDHTFYGRIGAELQEEPRESPLKLRLANLAASIGKFGYVAAIFTAVAYLFNNIVLDNQFSAPLIWQTVTSWRAMLPLMIQACTLAVTVIVMAVPEGLPMMITVVLSANMKRMLKDHVLVRKLVGIETAGSLNILFTDKTGTLTRGKLDVTHFVSGTGHLWTRGEIERETRQIGRIVCDSIAYNTASTLSEGTAIGGNATDRALLQFASGLTGGYHGLHRTNILPFSSATKLMATTVSGAWNATLIKGAPEKILPFCTQYYDESGNRLLFTGRKRLERLMGELGDSAVRMIALAVTEPAITDASHLRNLTLVGLIGIRDELRPEAIEGIAQVLSAGIQTVMITGDSRTTALALAKEAGLIRSADDIVLTSEEMAQLSDTSLSQMLPKLRVVARALPSDKSRLVRIAQSGGLVVGMTGDGVNDAPALKQADIGFAMGSGTEVAKEAGDIVILNDHFGSIAKAVCYGRTIFKSIRKFIIYQMSICMCAVGVTVIGPLVDVDFPITVIQMLWINIVMDTLAGLAFSGEKARIEYMHEPPKRRDERIINPYMKGHIAVSSIYATILCLLFLKSPLMTGHLNQNNTLYAMTAFFALFMFCAIFSSFSARTHRFNLLDGLADNRAFLWIMGLVTCIQLAILYFGGTVFRTVPLDFDDLITVILLAFTVIPVDLIRKYVLYRNSPAQGT